LSYKRHLCPGYIYGMTRTRSHSLRAPQHLTLDIEHFSAGVPDPSTVIATQGDQVSAGHDLEMCCTELLRAVRPRIQPFDQIVIRERRLVVRERPQSKNRICQDSFPIFPSNPALLLDTLGY